MNWLVILVILILLAYALRGMKVGFIKTVFSILSLIIALLFASIFSPMVSKTLSSNKKLTTYITEKVEKTINIKVDTSSKTEEIDAIESLKLPKNLINALKENNNAEVKKALKVGEDGLKNYVVKYLVQVIMNAVAYLITFVVIIIILFVISNVLNVISRLPLLNGLNKTAGLLVGLLKGLVVIWLLCIVLTVFSGTNTGQIFFEQIENSRLLTAIYDNNLFMNFITNMAKVLF